jgi:hypothetical protein
MNGDNGAVFHLAVQLTIRGKDAILGTGSNLKLDGSFRM